MNRYIPDEIIEEIRGRCDIVDLVNSYVPLKQAGSHWQACCPFHEEKTPSFKVNPQRQIYHCFGCGKGGNIFTFVMEREGVDFPEAARMLAQKYGIFIPETSSGDRTSSRQESPDVKERIYLLHEKIKVWFERNLWTNPQSPVALYLAQRQIPEEISRKFGIGAAPDSWDAALNWGKREGFTEKELLDAGIIIENRDTPNVRIYDRFRNRLIFSICDEQNRVVAFSARTIEKDPEGAKYVNSPETPIFRKSRILYGLSLARQAVKQKGFIILCEGQLDVIAMHRAGFENTAAPQGTAFTEEQARIIKRYTDCLYIAFDADKAGIKASLRAFEIVLPLGFQVKTISFPGGKDPDELFKNSGPDAISEAVEKASDFFDFLIEKLSLEYDISTPSGKGNMVAEVLMVLAKIDNSITRSSYISRLALRLGIPEEAVFSEMKKLPKSAAYSTAAERKNDSQPSTPPATKNISTLEESLRIAEETLLELALVNGNVCKKIEAELPTEMISSTPVGKALELVIQMNMNDEWEFAARALSEGLTENPDPSISRILALSSNVAQSKQDKAVSDCISRIKIRFLRDDIKKIKQDMAQSPDNPEQMLKYQEKRKELLALEKRTKENS
ncbi:MAG: DNA primase [Lentisphaerae bacterium GWF2_44_16]|nr:MAG: DNA primase [Lentisphaerae bacterium GWF2_44_16]